MSRSLQAAALRVVMPIYYFLPVMGGAEQQACRLAGELQRRGHQVLILTGRWQSAWAADERVAGVPVRRIWTLWPGLDRCRGFFLRHAAFEIGLAWHLVKNRRRYDVIHVHQALHAAFVATLVARLIGKPVLVKVGCGGQFSDIRIMRENIVNPISGLFWKVIRKCDRFVAISREIELELEQDGIKAERILRIPNGIEPGSYRPKSYGGHATPLRLVSVGRLDPQKAYEVLLEALYLMPGPACELRIYGEGKERAALQALVRARGLGDRVFLEGVVDDLPRRLPEGDLFVLVSRAEGLSNALMEAMLCGLPCIVSAVGGNADLISPEDLDARVAPGACLIASNGVLVNSDDPQGTAAAIALLAADPELAARLGRSSADWMRRNNALAGVAERYLDLYRALLQPGKGRTGS